MAEELLAPGPPIAAFDVPLLRIDAVVKKFGAFRAVDGLSLDIRAGEFFALLGPSGCGKTTLLRMLAGFETPDEGRILLDGKDIAQVPPHQRPVNMMFQNYALFPHLNVRDNIAFGLKRAGMARAEIDTRVAEMVALVKLEGLEKRKPDQLSGGQKQRVALARSLARRPQVLLLDEPLAALDKKLRESTQLELMELQRRLGMTFIIVTHDQEEAMTVADRIGVMDAGRLEQVATPRELYEAPRSRWVAEFVGDINLFEGEIEPREAPMTMAPRLAIATRDAGTIYRRRAAPAGRRKPIVCVAIRPEKVKLSRRGAGSDADDAHAINRLEGVVTDVSYLGGLTTYKVQARQRRGAALVDGQHRAARSRRLQPEPARGGVVHARRLRGAGAMSAPPHLHPPGAARRDRALSVDGAVLPGAVRLRAQDQPVADRDRAAALYCRCSTSREGLAAIKAAFAALSLDNFRLLFSDDLYVLSYLRSLVVAAVSTSILLLIGYPIAYGMARLPRRWQSVAMMLVIVPFWTSFLIRIYAWINILQHDGLLNQILLALHLVSAPVVWLSTDSAMYLGIVYSYLPFMILPLYATLAKMEPALLEAAERSRRLAAARRSGW